MAEAEAGSLFSSTPDAMPGVEWVGCWDLLVWCGSALWVAVQGLFAGWVGGVCCASRLAVDSCGGECTFCSVG
jgi:hypothetical protein